MKKVSRSIGAATVVFEEEYIVLWSELISICGMYW